MIRFSFIILIFVMLTKNICGQNSDCSNIGVILDKDQVCDPMNNVFSQVFNLEFAELKGRVIVGDTSFTPTNPKAKFTYMALSDFKVDTIVIYFESDPLCRDSIILQAPKNCCPFDLKLDSFYTSCIGTPLNIGVQKGNLILNWIDPEGKFIGSNDSIKLLQPGQYKLIARSLTGCERSTTFNVIFKNKPTLFLPSSFATCRNFGPPIPLTSDATTFNWAVNGIPIDTAKSARLIPVESGNYTITASYSNSCPVIATTSVTIKNALKPNLGEDLKKCSTDKVNLAIAEIGSAIWFKDDVLLVNEFIKTLNITESGSYRARLTGPNNCSEEDTVNVLIVPKPFLELGNGFGLCAGAMSTIQGSADVDKLLWKKDGSGLLDTGLILNINTAGMYSASAISANLSSCTASDTIVITSLARPIITVPAEFLDTIYICQNESSNIVFPQQQGLKYEWKIDGKTISATNEVFLNQSGKLTYSVSNFNRCTLNDSALVVLTETPIIKFQQDADSLCFGDSIPIPFKMGFTSSLFLDNKLLDIVQGGIYDAKRNGVYILKGEGIYKGKTCTANDTLIVKVFDQPIFDLGKNDSFCNQYIIKPDRLYPKLNYRWSMNGQRIDSTSQTLTAKNSGLYALDLISTEGCKYADSLRIVVLPEVSIVSDLNSLSTCDSLIKLELETKNAKNLKWELNGSEIVNEITSNLSISKSGVYTLEASNERCLANKSITVKFAQPLIINLGSDTILCDGQSINLNGPPDAAKYKWSTGDTIKNIIIKSLSNPTRTALEVISKEGCISKGSLLVTPASAIDLKLKSNLIPLCLNETKNIIVSGANKINWSSTSPFNTINDTTISVFLNQDITLTAKTSNHCGVDSLFIILKPIAIPDVLVSQDTCIYEGKSATLMLKSGYKYQWQSHPSIKGALTNNFINVSPDSSVLYRVTTSDVNGCIRLDSIDVCVVLLDEEKFVPITVITPNGDGKNDELKFELLDLIQPNRLVIYNRWGNVVFEKNNYQSDDELFDGTKNGEQLPTDVYYYVLTFQDKVHRESLTIVRN